MGIPLRASQFVDALGTLVTIGPSGEIVSKRKPASEVEEFFSDFSVVHWPAGCNAGDCLLVSGSEAFFLLGQDDESVVTKLGPAAYTMHARGLSIRLSETEPPLLAVVGSLPYQGGQWAGLKAIHGAVYLFNAHGNLVYHEVLPEPVEALGVLLTADGKTETLLIGGENKVWQYSGSQRNLQRSRQSLN
jgi:hypothetical protein